MYATYFLKILTKKYTESDEITPKARILTLKTKASKINKRWNEISTAAADFNCK